MTIFISSKLQKSNFKPWLEIPGPQKMGVIEKNNAETKVTYLWVQ